MDTQSIVEQTTPDATMESSPITEPQPELGSASPETTTASGTVETAENTERNGAEPSAAEKRIQQLVAKSKESEREAQYWRERAIAQPSVPQDTGSPVPPNEDDFDSYAAFDKAKEDYIVARAEYQLTQKFRQAQQSTTESLTNARFQERIDAAILEDPTIAVIMEDKTLPISNTMSQLIRESDTAPQLIKFFHNNRALATRLYNASPLLVAKEIGKIEAILQNAPKPEPPKKVSQAPTPIQTVQTVGSTEPDEDSLPIDEWVRRRNATAARR